MARETFKDVRDETDLRTVGASAQFIKGEERRVRGLAEGQVISYRNKAGTRFRHLQRIWGRTCLVIPPYDSKDKYSLTLQESELLAKMSTLRKHKKRFEEMTEETREKKERSDARKKKQKA